jgi:hypothetical protein
MTATTFALLHFPYFSDVTVVIVSYFNRAFTDEIVVKLCYFSIHIFQM